VTLQKAGKRTLRKQENQVKALELRRKGNTYLAIAKALGISPAGAHGLVQAALLATIQEPSEAVRVLELERLDFLTKKLEKRINSGEDKAINTFLKVMDHRARLLGLFVTDPQTNVNVIIEAPRESRERVYAKLID
jgi:transcriptional regulator